MQGAGAARAPPAASYGGERVEVGGEAVYVRPALVEMPAQAGSVRRETFAPILYVLQYRDLDEAIALQNDVPQGLSSSIFTRDLGEAEHFLSAAARTAASPTSTSAPPAPRSAGPSAAKRRPAAAANPARTAGTPICGAPPTPQLRLARCRWPRA